MTEPPCRAKGFAKKIKIAGEALEREGFPGFYVIRAAGDLAAAQKRDVLRI